MKHKLATVSFKPMLSRGTTQDCQDFSKIHTHLGLKHTWMHEYICAHIKMERQIVSIIPG